MEIPLAFLQNDYHCSIFYLDMLYPTLEHAYQAQKIEVKKDGYRERSVIGRLRTAKQAKEAGDNIQMSLTHADWFRKNKRRIMKELTIAKFQQRQMAIWLVNLPSSCIVQELGQTCQCEDIIEIWEQLNMRDHHK